MSNSRWSDQKYSAIAWLLVLAGLVVAGVVTSVGATNRTAFWSDSQNGFAIGGFDPVAYFVEGQARPGEPGREFDWRGVPWLFANDGNRAAFAADPDTYSPRFGGFDPVAVSRGNPAEGNPRIWAVYEGNLLLFYSRAFKTLWELDRDGVLNAARESWPNINFDRPID